jgi:hypothetical protein
MAKVYPTATHWTTKGDDGQLKLIAVTDMSTSHLIRWVKLFRKKNREALSALLGHETNLVIDKYIRLTMPTGEAVYTELQNRGINVLGDPEWDLDHELELEKAAALKGKVTIQPIGQWAEVSANVDALTGALHASSSALNDLVSEWSQLTITTTTNTTKSSRKKKLQRDMLKAKAKEKELARMTAPEPGAAKRKIRL